MRDYLKALGVIATLDDLKHPAAEGLNPFNELTCIAAIRPDQAKARKDPEKFHKDEFRAISVLDARAMHNNSEQQTQGIYRDVTLTALDLLA